MYLKFFTIILVASLPFLFTLTGEFVFDDSEAIVKNKDVVSNPLTQIFYSDFWGTAIKSNTSHKSYRPLTILTFRLNYVLSGNKLVPFHFKLVNLICHMISCVLLWLTFQSLLSCICYSKKIENIAFLATILFAVHPIHVEAVSGVVGRADLLSAISFFSSFLLYNKANNGSNKSYLYVLASILFAFCSMLFKENGVTVLGFCFVYELTKIKFTIVYYVKKKKILGNCIFEEKVRWNSVIKLVVLFTSTVILLIGRWTIMGGSKPVFNAIDNPAAFSESYFVKIATYNYIYFVNMLLLVWPQWLCFDWSMGCIPLIKSLFDYRIMFIFILYGFGMSILYYIIHIAKVFKRAVFMAVVLLILPFLPASNIFFPVGFVIAERVLYIPSAGYCLLVVLGYEKFVEYCKKNTRMIVRNLFYVLILIYTAKSWERSQDWQEEYQLFISGLSVCPQNAKVHYNVAKVADANNETMRAVKEYQEAIRLYPDYYQAMNNLANVLKSLRRYREAKTYLETAIKLKRDFPAAWMNLGIVYASTLQFKEAQNAYETAIKYRKNYPDCFFNLGNLFLEMNEDTKALSAWQQAIKLDPKHASAWTNVLSLLDNTGDKILAMELIPKALFELPNSATIHFVVANIYGKLELFREAEKHFLKAIELFGDQVHPLHYNNLGVLYHRWGKHHLAEGAYVDALKINPKFPSAQKNLKSLQKLYENKTK